MIPIYIGFDPREKEAYDVCVDSIIRHTSIPVSCIPLDQKRLRDDGLYWRKWRMEKGQRIDLLDKKPFSTEFSFSRFLVPSLEKSSPIAIYCDCDFLFTDDIAKLTKLYDPKCAVQVVKHIHIPSEKEKMDGVQQTVYFRKNWSSMVLWNLDHPANRLLTPNLVNHNPGSWLHAFRWLLDEEIGCLPITWNWLSGVSDPIEEIPKAIHYTLGIPTMTGCENYPYADLWRKEFNRRNQTA